MNLNIATKTQDILSLSHFIPSLVYSNDRKPTDYFTQTKIVKSYVLHLKLVVYYNPHFRLLQETGVLNLLEI